MRFAQPEFLYLLAIAPLLILFFIVRFRHRRDVLMKLGEQALLDRLSRSTVAGRQPVKAALVVLALVCFVLALARPQFGTRSETIRQTGFSVMAALDVSNSMLAEDVRPNRLIRAKYAVRSLVRKLRNDQIGLVVFAGSAFLQCPLTSDYSIVELFLDGIDTRTVGTQGTAISQALQIAGQSFQQDHRGYKAIVLITDGEDHQEDPVAVAADLAAQGVRVYVVGIGTPNGVPIPIMGEDGTVAGHMRDRSGAVVMSRLDESTLRQIAETTGGAYYRASPGGEEMDLVYDTISSLERAEFESREFTQYVERFQYILLFGLLLLVADTVIRDRRLLDVSPESEPKP
ncbi:MAG: VWA domain-containing protein [Gemmatimonadetes bacterium]|nr:VWA domain-containing protein [Gemmatimonadota bacterium]